MTKKIKLLCAPRDRAALSELLAALREKGVDLSDGAPGKNDTVLTALSEGFYADQAKCDALLSLVAAGAEVLPLQLDAAPVPDELKNALYARNILPAQGREAALLADRIAAALPEKKSRLPVWLTLGGAAALAVIGLFLWRGNRPAEEPSVPVMAEPAVQDVYFPNGLTEADLADVDSVVIVGDLVLFGSIQEGRTVNFETGAHGTWEVDSAHWYSKTDGHEYQMTHYDDLRFLAMLPNLRELNMALVEAPREALPELRGMLPEGGVWISDCAIDSLDWLAGCEMRGLLYNRSAVTDFSPLTECEKLSDAGIDLWGQSRAELGGFCPPALEALRLGNAQGCSDMDLSALSRCEKLRELEISFLPIADLSFLSGMEGLERVSIEYMDNPFRDISALGELKQLRELYIGYCPGITDYSPIAGCTALESIHVQGDFNHEGLTDASFLSDLPRLRDIHLYSCNLRNMDFLEGIAAHQDSIRLGFAGDILDYSGLQYIRHFDYLHVNPRFYNGSRGGEFSAVLPYIRDAEIDYLMLFQCSGVDLSQLPDGITKLSIRYGDLADLSGLKLSTLEMLELWDCQYLRSLDGIEALPALSGKGNPLELFVTGCPRLTDWSALDNAILIGLKLQGVSPLPKLRLRELSGLHLTGIPELRDLNCLDDLLVDGMDCVLKLSDLPELYDLSPLRSRHGELLFVPPQVADQAAELVENGNYQRYEVIYPDGSWQPYDGPAELLSLDELSTLPGAMLRRVERLCIVGDEFIDPNREGVDEEAIDGAGIVTDLSVFAPLEGLREMALYAQPLESLDGAQNLTALETLRVRDCPALTDASAAFACQQLRALDLHGCPLESIQGVQNLWELEELDLSHTAVRDLTPLLELDSLQTVRLSEDMREAMESLGDNIPFQVDIVG